MEEYKEPYKEQLFDIKNHRVDLPESFRIICCPNCSKEIPADHLYIEEKVGKCGSCKGVFSIEEDIRGLAKATKKIRQEILRPEGIELFHYQDELEISFEQPMTWAEWPFLILIGIFALIGFGASTEIGSIVPFLFFSVVPSLLAFFYSLRRRLKHRIFLSIDDQYLNIQWRPKKLHVDQSYKVNDIRQLYVKHISDLGIWRVFMIIDEGNGHKHVKLTSVSTASKAKYLEQEIESHLNIQDVEVPEES